MNKSLAQSFRDSNGRRVKWQGRHVHSFHQLSAKDGDVIEISRLSASSTRAQALKIAVDKGDLRANGVLMPTVAIWTHTSPAETTLEVVGRRARTIDIWNSWSFEGVDSAWLGDAGMLIESDGKSHVLRCSDGLASPTFDDLVVRIKVVSSG